MSHRTIAGAFYKASGDGVDCAAVFNEEKQCSGGEGACETVTISGASTAAAAASVLAAGLATAALC